jgi:multiple sugar transport system permease protein
VKGLHRGEARAGWLLAAPALLVIAAFFLLPVAAGFALSVTDFDIYAIGDPDLVRFVGAANYRTLLNEPLFWKALKNTLYFVLLGVPATMGVALAAALGVTAGVTRLKPVFRTVYFAPVVTTLVAVAVVWRYLYHPRFGLINGFLGAFGVGPIAWLADPRWAMPAIVLLAVWKNFGYTMIIFVAGLQAIPEQLYEAARLDGASVWQRFRHITLPGLAPTTTFVAVITVIGYFQLFAEPYVMTSGGGPVNATLSVVLYMFKEGFRWWNIGYAAAAAFVLFWIILAVTLVQTAARRRAER